VPIPPQGPGPHRA